MSCNCGNTSSNCWSSNFLNPADPCPVGPECVDKISTDCVIYTGPDLPCLGITTNMTLTEVLHILYEGIYPECFTTTTTTTSLPTTTTSTTQAVTTTTTVGETTTTTTVLPTTTTTTEGETTTTTSSSTTTTTTVAPGPCFCYVIFNPTESTLFMTWTRCDDGALVSQSIDPGSTFYRCSSTFVTGSPGLIINTEGLLCSQDSDCIP